MMPADQRFQALLERIDTRIATIAPPAIQMLRSTKRHVYIYLNELCKVFFFDTYEFEGSPNTKCIETVYYRDLLLIASGKENVDSKEEWQELEKSVTGEQLEEAFSKYLKRETRHMAVTAVFQ